jgi:predicted acylesterase/phospholipase RssA
MSTQPTVRRVSPLFTAILPAFPPVEVDGRVLCDAGYTNNLPLDPLFETEPARTRA